jgi:5'-3' exoribonuclease 1
MGIPSYFSYIIKNYSNIMRNLQTLHNEKIQFQHLYMDCNSIIYDIFHKMDDKTISDIEEQLIVGVIQKIEEYIFYIHPTKTIYIAFDGVAPFAKMDQQRTRRYKGTLQTSSVQLKNWSTSNITPGTLFMEKLSRAVHIAFSSQEEKYKAKHIIVSTSNEVGEGEHKIFQYIRNQIDIQNDYCALYGLDSDLIMLSIFHCKLFKNIYILSIILDISGFLITFSSVFAIFFMSFARARVSSLRVR